MSTDRARNTDWTGASVAGAGLIAALAASGRATTRASLVRETGLSRSTMSHRLDALFAAGLLHEAEESQYSGGRPAKVIALTRDFGVTLAVDVGEDHVRVALCDLGPQVLVERVVELPLSEGPERVLADVEVVAHSLLEEIGLPESSVLGIGLALPAPVDFVHGKVVGFSVLSGWDGFDIREWFAHRLDVPVLADNDVNLLALAEHRLVWPDASSLLYVKAGNGIGSGILNGPDLYRGAQGAAGDIGHIQLDGHGDPLCRCGNVGCVEALAAGWALVRDLKRAGFPVETSADVVALAAAGEPQAIQRVRAAGRMLGEAVAHATSLLNPAVIVIGGTLSKAGDPLLAGIREMVYQRSLPLATRELRIATTALSEQAGVLGAAHLATESWLRPESIERILAKH